MEKANKLVSVRRFRKPEIKEWNKIFINNSLKVMFNISKLVSFKKPAMENQELKE